MALQDLVINNQQISTEIIEGLLKGRVNLIQEGRMVHLTKEGMHFPNKAKILLFLAGGKAWELLDGEGWNSLPGVMEEILGIPGNTLRPVLKELADNFLVKSEKGKYQILSKGIYELEAMMGKKEGEESSAQKSNSKQKKTVSDKKSAGGPSKSKAIEELIKGDYFSVPRDLSEIQTELGRRGISVKLTSLPSYLLPLVRSNTFNRDYKVKGQRKVWAYVTPPK